MALTARARRRLILAAAFVAGGVVLSVVALGIVYPRVAAWYVRSKVVPRLEARFGRKVAIGRIEVDLGHAVLRDVVVRGARDGADPLARFDRVDIEFDGWRSLYGSARVERVEVRGGKVAVHRGKDGVSNVEDLIDRLEGGGHGAGGHRGLGSLSPGRAALAGVQLAIDDEAAGVHGGAAELAATYVRGGRTLIAVEHPEIVIDFGAWLDQFVHALDFHFMDPDPGVEKVRGPRIAAARVTITRDASGRQVEIADGELEPWRGLALTGITGSLRDDDHPGRLALALDGGYGGVAGRLWTAAGWVEPAALAGEVKLTAARFSLDRLRPILEHSSLIDFQKTTVDAELTLTLTRALTTFVGDFHLHDLTVGHPMLAEKPVRDLDISGDVAGSFDRRTRTLALTRGDFVSRDLPFRLTGTLALPGGVTGPELRRKRPAVTGRFVIPPIDCQQALEALPPEMTPYMQGYVLKGTFSTDLQVAIDWENLEATQLGGSVGIRGCRIVKIPPEMKRLEGSFDHYVEVERGKWLTFTIGPENPDFVPIAEVSPNLINSLMTTEDGAFYHHHGFITSEFKSALIKNLQAGYFRYGASSITMQTVKNVLLYREKTLSRKLQELFLTWSIEQELDKDRILEIYVNAIEYGPGLYGIGAAARQYFGKSAHDLTAKEAAFFSTILPSPKARYRQYCNGTLYNWTGDKIDRILELMLKRGRLTQEEYDAAVAQPLVFVKDGSETEAECNARVNHAIKSARPTNPMKK